MSDEYEVPTMMAKATGADRSDSATVGITPEEMAIRWAVADRLKADPKAQETFGEYERKRYEEKEWWKARRQEMWLKIKIAEDDHERRLQKLEAETDKAMRERWDEIEAEIRAQGVTRQETG